MGSFFLLAYSVFSLSAMAATDVKLSLVQRTYVFDGDFQKDVKDCRVIVPGSLGCELNLREGEKVLKGSGAGNKLAQVIVQGSSDYRGGALVEFSNVSDAVDLSVKLSQEPLSVTILISKP